MVFLCHPKRACGILSGDSSPECKDAFYVKGRETASLENIKDSDERREIPRANVYITWEK